MDRHYASSQDHVQRHHVMLKRSDALSALEVEETGDRKEIDGFKIFIVETTGHV